MGNLPTGTVTFLFTDIEGSTRLAQLYPDAISGLLERHHAILKSAIEGHGGYIFQIIGDAFCAAFQTVPEALDAALEAQRRMAAESWLPEAVRVRMGISTGTAQVKLQEGRPPDYSGYLSLARVQRVMSVAYGGQILLADASAGLVRGELPQNVTLRDLGECHLKSLLSTERIWQVTAPGLQSDFPPLQLVSLVGDESLSQEVLQLLERHPLKLPPFLEGRADAQFPAFVTRERELARLEHLLSHALEGRGQVAFITGDPGQGKTALAREFARLAVERCAELAVASGNCDPYTGTGDPYLPFRETLALLCGDVRAGWEARAISREQAWRLWQCMPAAVEAVALTGRDLVGTLLAGDLLARQASTLAAIIGHGQWFAEVDQLVRTKASAPADPGLQQAALFEQYLRVLREIAQHKPLLLILDDLQWADRGSINLLSHLGKRIQGSRLMILGTYRNTELALGWDGQRHPLEPILNEFKRQFGDIQIDLGEDDGQRFVEAFIDSEPNRLGEDFRATLFRVTGGHPLATIELLHDLQERGGIVRDAPGAWIEGPTLNWEALPARVEAMIAERVERLDVHARRVLQVASVEGETFTAEVVAHVLNEEQQGILSLLSDELDRRHHLVRAQSVRQQDGHQLSTYRFQHHLFQRYVLGSLDVVARSSLHRSVGIALQELYAERGQEISGQLARQFQEAGTTEQAAEYLVKAGDRARSLYAHQEAIDYYRQAQKAYEVALGSGWSPLRRAQLERKIGESLFDKGEHDPAAQHFRNALAYLGEGLPSTPWRTRLTIAGEIIRQMIHRLWPSKFLGPPDASVSESVAEAGGILESLSWIAAFDPEQFVLISLKMMNFSESNHFRPGIIDGFATLGLIADFMAFRPLAQSYFDKALMLSEQSQNLAVLGVVYSMLAIHENIQGHWNKTLEYVQRAADAEYESPYWSIRGWASALMNKADAYIHLGDFARALENANLLVQFSQERNDPQARCWGLSRQGYARRGLGRTEEAIEALQKAMVLARSVPDYQTYVDAGGELGQCYLRQGKLEQSFAIFEDCQRRSIEHNLMQSPVITRFRNGLAEACLLALERSYYSERAGWLKKAARACRAAVGQGRAYPPGTAEALMLRGRYEWLKGDRAFAERWWRQSMNLAEGMGIRYDLGRILLEIGSRTGERQYLERANTIFSEIGAAWDLERASEALKAAA